MDVNVGQPYFGLPPSLSERKNENLTFDLPPLEPQEEVDRREIPPRSAITSGETDQTNKKAKHVDFQESPDQEPTQNDSGYERNSFMESIEGNSIQQKLFQCSRGEYKELWYKFKRFETLNLLNLYYYQHELIDLESKIDRPPDGEERPGHIKQSELLKMRRLLREYFRAVKDFEEISRMPRPSHQERIDTVDKLSKVLGEAHYSQAADAYGLMDMTPQAFGVQPDAIRILARAVTARVAKEKKIGILRGATVVLSGRNFPTPDPEDIIQTDEGVEERKPGTSTTRTTISFAGRPYQVPISKGIDMSARILISVISDFFLLVPMFTLSYVHERSYRLATTALFTVFFAIALSVLSEAKNQELMTATAAYTAVLVVFIAS